MRKELNAEEIRELGEKIQKQFGWSLDPSLKYFAKDEKEGVKIFLYSGGTLPELPAEWIGLHIGTLVGEDFRPSIDGAGLMKTSAKNILQITRKEIESVMAGMDVENKNHHEGALILLSGDLACIGMAQEGVIKSLTPQSRRTGHA
jgi:NOL1/NOP2/fmu family ribosome biogenesis protein